MLLLLSAATDLSTAARILKLQLHPNAGGTISPNGDNDKATHTLVGQVTAISTNGGTNNTTPTSADSNNTTHTSTVHVSTTFTRRQ
ncbi:hypothetical protein PF004_g27741 [Phytophthora fragariae]|uniref:Uncharacterized protein n=1 Tax=Phytophthora fragariae TaxID=53985 RepID=A0A6G0MKS8_9STRA|nr:hypothetical protein PF004_g27741 [Phytophthora fragariae]